jgi:lipoprotein NlpD
MNMTLRSKDLLGVTSALVVIGCLLSGCVSQIPPVPEASQAQIANAAQTASAQPASVVAGYYRVNQGDTVESIAAAYGRNPAEIENWNSIPRYPALPVGQVMRVAPPSDPAEVTLAESEVTPLVASGKPEAAASKAQVAASKPDVAAVKPAVSAAPVSRAASDAACSANALAWPVQGPLLGTFGKDGSHAILIGGKAGDAVKAADSGRVLYAGSRVKGYGQLVIVKHGEHYLTAYGYNQKLFVKEGAKVKQGQTIAEMGSATGRAALLFEVRKDRRPVDPLPYLKRCTS